MPTALVTGATAGLGAEFARQLAGAGYDLVLVARDAARLDTARDDLATLHGVRVETLTADLATDAGCATVSDRLTAAEPAPVDLLVNNAGIGTYAAFGTAELAKEEAQLDLNVRAVMRLAHAAVRSMTGRGRGHILNVGSVAGFLPRGGNVTYSASKAWVTMFSEALAVQLADSPVSVTVVCPGFVHTEFHQRADTDMSHVPDRMWLESPDVVREALADLFAGKTISVPSRRWKAFVTSMRSLPRPVVRQIMIRRGM